MSQTRRMVWAAVLAAGCGDPKEPRPHSMWNDSVRTCRDREEQLSTELKAAREDLKAAQERGDGWRDFAVDGISLLNDPDKYPPRTPGYIPACRTNIQNVPPDVCWHKERRARCRDGEPFCLYPRDYGQLEECALWMLEKDEEREMRQGADGLTCLGTDRSLRDKFQAMDVSVAHADLVCDSNGDPVCMIDE